MQKTHAYEIQLRTRDCDMLGLWKPSAVLEAMQDAAGMHSTALGCGRETLVRSGLVWVITRCEMRFDALPRVLESVRIETFPMPLRHWFFPRHFIFRDEAGGELGAASTLWVMFDLKNRRMAEPGEVAKCIPDNSDLTPPLGAPRMPRRLSGACAQSARLPVFSEIDVNGHVNNARYADWLCDALGMETMREYRVETMQISFASEILPGEEMTLELAREGLSYYFVGSRDQKAHFEIGGTLARR